MILLKKGVEIYGLSRYICKAIDAADIIYQKHKRTLVITSARDSVHGTHSKHYIGDAIDTRIFYFTKDVVQLVVKELKDALGANYDVVLEGNHIHIEFDPK